MITFLVAVIISGITIFILISLLNNQSNDLDKTPFREAWRSIIEKSKNEHTWEMSIINADKLLDLALRKKGYKGATMGERLISAKSSLSNRNSVWEAHKLRNRLVHEHSTKLNESRVISALKGFENALKDLGAL